MSPLKAQQIAFTSLLPMLLLDAAMLGHAPVAKEVHRTAEQAQWYKDRGLGEHPSIHELDLAIDLVLCDPVSGDPIWDLEAYRILAAKWESLHPDARWGGDFTRRRDGVHFSLAFGGLE